MVMSGCTVEPGSDAGVVKLSIAGINKFLAIANDCNNRFCYLDPYAGAQIAFAECMRNLACSGARALAVTDNLNFGNPNKPEAYHMLKECVKGLADACAHFDVPVVGGNVSLYNEHGEGAIDPTPVVSMVGLIDQADRVTRSCVWEAGVELILLGGLPHELGGSYYLQTQFVKKEGACPVVDLTAEKNLQDFLISQIEDGKIHAAHDLAEGGLLVCLAEMLFGAEELGASVSLPDLGSSGRLDSLLFGESQARAVIAVRSADREVVLQAAESIGLSTNSLGQTNDSDELKVEVGSRSVLNAQVSGLKNAWESAIPKHMDIA
jgi:phosphoribosylformylglycinamidine (FGAM) synthase-like enzyme